MTPRPPQATAAPGIEAPVERVTGAAWAPPRPAGGPWRLVGGIYRWTDAVTADELADLRARLRGPRKVTAPLDPALIACPTCGARVTQNCRTAGGNPTAPHAGRIVSRRCLCGEVVGWKKQLCEPCRQRARKQTYRLRELRKPSRERRKAA